MTSRMGLDHASNNYPLFVLLQAGQLEWLEHFLGALGRGHNALAFNRPMLFDVLGDLRPWAYRCM